MLHLVGVHVHQVHRIRVLVHEVDARVAVVREVVDEVVDDVRDAGGVEGAELVAHRLADALLRLRIAGDVDAEDRGAAPCARGSTRAARRRGSPVERHAGVDDAAARPRGLRATVPRTSGFNTGSAGSTTRR